MASEMYHDIIHLLHELPSKQSLRGIVIGGAQIANSSDLTGLAVKRCVPGTDKTKSAPKALAGVRNPDCGCAKSRSTANTLATDVKA